MSNEGIRQNTPEEENLKNYFLNGAKKENLEIENLDIFFKNDQKNSMSKTILEEAKSYLEDPLRMLTHLIMSQPEYQLG